jgi:DNA-binding transcriptional regulator YiaG
MGPQNRLLRSPDPQDQLGEPLDQSSANAEIRAPALDLGRLGWGEPCALDVRALRRKMRLTQRQFAGWFGFPVATLRHWERGNRKPAGTALVLLNVIRENPGVVLRAVRKARTREPAILAAIEPHKSYRAAPGEGERRPPLRPRRSRRPG